ARLLGHQLDLRTRLGRGSVFSVTVARAQPAPAENSAEPARARAIGLAADRRVLCIDNDAAILDGMATLLAQWGVASDLAGDIASAVDAARRRRPDLVLADYHLDAGENGIDALARVRAACEPPPPGALITADHGAELHAQAREAGY